MKRFCLILALVAMIQSPAHARMYQWVDPDTGTTQLSGKPPAWYRSGRVGPRIFVFENGQIIDDTDVVLSDEHRMLMRERAYLKADEDIAKAKERAIEASRASAEKQSRSQSDESMEEDTDMVDDELAGQQAGLQAEKEDEEPGKQTRMSADDMKQLILDWEKLQEEQARQVIGDQ